MSTDLVDYAKRAFPRHDIAPWHEGDDHMVLESHTLVVHVVGTVPAAEVLETAERVAGYDRVGAVVVLPSEPTVVRQPDEDTNGIVDLPARRLVASGVTGAVVGMGAGTAVGAMASSGIAPALIVGAFAAVVCGVVGAVAGGGARYAGERATSQPPAPGRNIAIVAAHCDDEAAASSLARAVVHDHQEFDVRIVGTDGSWHAPSS
jgi:hypothetical protein